jgi:glucose-1-phosphate adenylyltransferase
MKQSSAHASLSEKEVEQANVQSKALIGLGKEGRPILDYLLLNAEKAGYHNVYLVTGEQAEAFKSHYGKKDVNPFLGLTIRYATQYVPENRIKPFGTADALLQAMEQHPVLKTETFTVCNSDNLYSVEALKALRTNSNSNAFIAYDREGLLFSEERISRFALVILDSEQYLTNIIEKPAEAEYEKYRDSHGKFWVSMNIFKLNGSQILPFLKHCPVHPLRNEKELPTAILSMCKSVPKAIFGIFFKEHVPDLTSKADILALKNYIATHFPKNS